MSQSEINIDNSKVLLNKFKNTKFNNKNFKNVIINLNDYGYKLKGN